MIGSYVMEWFKFQKVKKNLECYKELFNLQYSWDSNSLSRGPTEGAQTTWPMKLIFCMKSNDEKCSFRRSKSSKSNPRRNPRIPPPPSLQKSSRIKRGKRNEEETAHKTLDGSTERAKICYKVFCLMTYIVFILFFFLLLSRARRSSSSTTTSSVKLLYTRFITNSAIVFFSLFFGVFSGILISIWSFSFLVESRLGFLEDFLKKKSKSAVDGPRK